MTSNKIFSNYSLKKYNSFAIDVFCDFFFSANSINEIKKSILSTDFKHKFILGEGSNILLTKNIKGLCIKINNLGIKLKEEKKEFVIIEAKAGENWNNLVNWCINRNYGGIENLALIPGSVGAAPIQNIGAYGVELKDVFYSCLAIDRQTGKLIELSNKECHFKYRSSIFKTTLKDKYVIISVCLKLKKKPFHILKTNYGDIQKITPAAPNIQNIANAIISIRQKKLPDPKKTGNAGSFFKNPIISYLKYQKLRSKYPNLPHFPHSKNKVKIPAAWLIEKSNFKGIKKGETAVHKNQALVLINLGKASGKDILCLSKKIQQTVKKNFDIVLSPEVTIF